MSENPYSAPKSSVDQSPLETVPSITTKLLGILSKGLGILLSALGFLGCLVSAHALLDPREVQLSNDADPFGAPPTAGETWLHLAVWFAVLCLGLWLFFRRRSRQVP